MLELRISSPVITLSRPNGDKNLSGKDCAMPQTDHASSAGDFFSSTAVDSVLPTNPHSRLIALAINVIDVPVAGRRRWRIFHRDQ